MNNSFKGEGKGARSLDVSPLHEYKYTVLVAGF